MSASHIHSFPLTKVTKPHPLIPSSAALTYHSHKPLISCIDQRTRSTRPTTIHTFAQSGDLNSVSRLLKDNPSLLNERNPVLCNRVLDNLKDYTVRALVNTVDQLGIVAYKLTDLVDQQTSDVSTIMVKVTCLNQKLLTFQTYMDKEGLRQLQLLAIIPRHHKRYILPNYVNKKVLHFSPSAQTDPRQM